MTTRSASLNNQNARGSSNGRSMEDVLLTSPKPLLLNFGSSMMDTNNKKKLIGNTPN